MMDDWYSTIELPLTIEQFRTVPRNAAYKYEYFGGRAVLSPRPNGYYSLLDLDTFSPLFADLPPSEKFAIRQLQGADWKRLPRLFSAAFHRVPPFSGLNDDECRKAAEDCIGRTREGGDGPHVQEACFVAVEDESPVGAILITLPTKHSLDGTDGLPHLTWVFVGPFHAHRGVGTALLQSAVQSLLQLGYARLVSTFLVGNESSMLWHWQAGFRLPEQPWSLRSIPRMNRGD